MRDAQSRGSELTPAPNGYPIKLVRDNTAEIINGSGEPGDLWYGETPEVDRLPWLRKKLVEEVAEYVVDGGPHELADVYAVVMALAHFEGVHPGDLLANDERGGFYECQMMYGRHEEFDVGPMAREGSGLTPPELEKVADWLLGPYG